MAWCCQATSHYLSQCWPRSLLPWLGHNELKQILKKDIFCIYIIFICLNYQNTCPITFIFGRCHHSIAVGTPAKYVGHLIDQTGKNFPKRRSPYGVVLDIEEKKVFSFKSAVPKKAPMHSFTWASDLTSRLLLRVQLTIIWYGFEYWIGVEQHYLNWCWPNSIPQCVPKS